MLAEEQHLAPHLQDVDGEAGQRQSVQTCFALGGVLTLRRIQFWDFGRRSKWLDDQ